MAKGGNKLMKLKSVMKKWQSSLGRTSSIAAAARSDDEDTTSGSLQAVYVGKSRRRYLISWEMMEHPVLRELVDRSQGSDTLTVRCEVVLFEHLLWMLQNADPHPESLEQLVQFYSC